MNPNEMSLTVSQLNEYVKSLIDGDEALQTATVRGEISNFKYHYASGHLYFSLKDDKCAIKCVMFAQNASRLRFRPDNGMSVTIWGRVSVFPRDGAYQLYASFMSPDGLGEQYAAYERLKAQLLAEGLCDEKRKKPIPKYPKNIGIITSPTGAAVRDLMNILERRWPVANIILYPALVQGIGAPSSLCEGVKYFCKNKNVDVIVIGRGGGSGEDLAAFNDETLARLIAASDIPVISAVGHETDFSISDLVADLRAPTPSAAAELAVPDSEEYIASISSLIDRCASILCQRISYAESKLSILSSSAVLSSPDRFILERESELGVIEQRLKFLYAETCRLRDGELSVLIGRLDALSPLSVLSRGYSIAQNDDGVIVSVEDVRVGDRISIKMNDGAITATVDSIEKN